MHLKIILIFGLFIITPLSKAQYLNDQTTVPPTPEAASFAKNVDIPMNLTSGIPEISIPIISVTSGIITIPISLSYNASGIRVEETPTWTGLGFNLNVGGRVTRVIHELPDDAQYGYINSPSNRKVKYVNSLAKGSSERYEIENIYRPLHQVDLEPDIFTFSILGYAGDFFWNQDSGKFLLSPFQNILVEHDMPLGQFILTLPDGNKCYFGRENYAIERVTYSATTSRTEGVSDDTPQEDMDAPYNTSWLITKIIDPLGKQILFEYQKKTVTEYGRGGEVAKSRLGSNNVATFFKRIIEQPYIKSIEGDDYKVLFVESTSQRLDVLDMRGYLEKIAIENKTRNEIKKFTFTYDYFTSPTGTKVWGIAIPFESVARKRLYLKSMTESAGNENLPPYLFYYNEMELPDRLSVSQDYWGYYNGKPNPSNGILALMPRLPQMIGMGLPNYPTNLPIDYLAGADRRIDLNYAQARVLKSIKFPTGGQVEYYYENNNVARTYFDPNSGLEPPDKLDKSFSFQPKIPSNPPYPFYYQDNFTILNRCTQVKITPILPAPCSDVASTSCRYTISIKSLDNNLINFSFNTTPSFYANLPNGRYQIEAVLTGDEYELPNFSVNLKWGEFSNADNFSVGGLRVNKIILKNEFGGTITKRFEYNLPSSTISSGILAGYPLYIRKIYDTSGNYLTFETTANSPIPLTQNGQTVRYQRVTEYIDSVSESLRTDYWFSCDFASTTFGSQTGAPPTLNSWKNGLLIQKMMYVKRNRNYYLVSLESNSYRSYKYHQDLYGLFGPFCPPYDLASDWYLLDTTIRTIYSNQADQEQNISIGTKYFYNDRFLLSNARTTDSRGRITDFKTKYPFDYNDLTGFYIPVLLEKNILSIPIKKESSTNGKVISGEIIKHNQFGQPIEVFKYENEFLKDTVKHNRNVIIEPGYKLKETVSYQNENPIEVLRSGNELTSIMWDYDPKYPVAQVSNTSQSNIAYTSFETFAKGGWTFSGLKDAVGGAITGGNSYSLNKGSISKAGLNNATKYIISYWSKGNVSIAGGTQSNKKTGRTISGWTYYEVAVSGATSVTISGNTYIDELRLYPADAQMTTYTYEPLKGMTSKCDANNKIIYYEYDEFGRLLIIRDENKNIIKKYSYVYAGQ